MSKKKAKKKTKSSPAKRVLIYSGGMDSFTLLHVQLAKGYDVYPLSFNYGQRHYRELEHAKEVCKRLDINHKHQIIQMESFAGLVRGASALTGGEEVPEGHYAEENMKQTVVPNRNMVMLSIATAYAISIGAETVLTGVHAGDHDIYPDCRTDFIDSMDATVKLANYDQIDIRAPFQQLTKGGILQRGANQAQQSP